MQADSTSAGISPSQDSPNTEETALPAKACTSIPNWSLRSLWRSHRMLIRGCFAHVLQWVQPRTRMQALRALCGRSWLLMECALPARDSVKVSRSLTTRTHLYARDCHTKVFWIKRWRPCCWKQGRVLCRVLCDNVYWQWTRPCCCLVAASCYVQ